MGWRSETFLEIQTRVLDQVNTLESFALYNYQFDQFKGDVNEELPLDFPNCFLSFAGGEWSLQTDYSREANPFTFRLHIGQVNYAQDHSGSNNQAEAIAHLDYIDELINALDGYTGFTHVEKLLFKREFIDEQRTNIIEHIIEFEGRVIDCSLQDAIANQTTQANDETIIRTSGAEANPYITNNQSQYSSGNY